MQAGENLSASKARRLRHGHAEPTVWTDRMLEALENGVKGGKWFSLIDKVTRLETLTLSWERVRKNNGTSGVDGQSVHRFSQSSERYLSELHEGLERETYAPQPVRRTHIPKGDGKTRPLGIPTIRDRVVQTALRTVIEPIFEVGFSARSFGFRPNRSCKDALRHVVAGLKEGRHFVVDADLKSYFDTIPHDKLMNLVKTKIADGRVLALIEAFLNQKVLEEMREWTPVKGTPQGAVISPLLANLYLDPLDKLMEASGWYMVRYADDFVVMCRSRAEAEEALGEIRAWTEAAGLILHPEKTRIVDARDRGGFEFLGYHFERGMRWPREKSRKKLKDAIRAKTPRNSGESLATSIEKVNRTLRGWFAYFKHSIWNIFRPLDGWIRMRLRAILRRRLKGTRSPYGLAHQKWPNSFFDDAGLFSLETARASLSRPRGGH